MRTVFFGTPNYAIASIRALLDADFEVPLICTRPAKRAGRGRIATPTPVAKFAEEVGIPAITPNRLDAAAMAAVESANADVVVVVAYGRFIPSEILSATQLGAVNIHPSLLPRHRGPSPVATAILDGDTFTGVSLMLLDEGMDTGPILSQSAPVEITQETRVDGLTDHLFEVGAGMLPNVLDDLASGVLLPQPQDDAGATVTRLIRKEDGVVDWDAPAERIVRMNRAFHPWPGTSTVWDGELLKLIDVEFVSGERIPSGFDPGVVFERDGQGVYVSTGDGSAVRLVEVQAAGTRVMSAGEFVVGRPDFIGARLGASRMSEK